MLPASLLTNPFLYPKTNYKATDEESVAFLISIVYYKGV